jgi:predicted transcriptional regulator
MDKNRIAKRIKKEYEAGATQTELADKYGISQSHINRLLTDPTSDMNMKLSLIKRMCLNATLHLDGADVDTVLIQNQKMVLDNIKKIINDPSIPDDKARRVIQILLD